MKHLPDEPTQEETNAYLEFWRTRHEKITKIMKWNGCYGFDPDLSFYRDRGGFSMVTLPLDVVDKIIELDERIATEPSISEGE